MELAIINIVFRAIALTMDQACHDIIKVQVQVIDDAETLVNNVWSQIEGKNFFTPAEFSVFNLALMLTNIRKTEKDGLCEVSTTDWYEEINQLKEMCKVSSIPEVTKNIPKVGA